MATFKFTIKNKPNANGEHSIIIQIIKDRKNTTLSLGKSCNYEDWSFETDRVKKTNKKHNYSNVFNAVSHIFSLHRDDYKSKYLNDILNYFDNLKNIKKGTLSVNNSLGENENENSFQILGNRLGQSLINNKIPLEDYEKLISHPIFEYGIKNDFIKVVKEDKIKKIKL